jgi:tRNA(Ile)-lysidine synthase
MAARRWCVALSGGLDSSVLLDVLCAWRSSVGGVPPLSAIHVHHGLHAQADAWLRHCEALCQRLQVPLTSHRVEVGPAGRGTEDAARRARYQVFERQLRSGDLLFMGHHLDDQVETFFLRLLRGAGIEGLAGMPGERSLGSGKLVRPLLAVSRAELEQYAGERSLNWVDDPSNIDTGMDRNFLRQELLPLLATRWPGYRRTVSRAALHMASAASGANGPPIITVRSVTGDPGLSLEGLLQLRPQELMSALRDWLRRRGLPMPAMAPLAEFTRQLQAGASDGSARLVWGENGMQRYRQGVYILPAQAFVPPPGRLTLAPDEPLRIAGVGVFQLLPAATGGLWLAQGETLGLAWREGGEHCRPVGRGVTRSLKKLLQEAGVPPWWRHRLPLFYRGDTLLAVADLWHCHDEPGREPAARPGAFWRVHWEPGTGVNEGELAQQ